MPLTKREKKRGCAMMFLLIKLIAYAFGMWFVFVSIEKMDSEPVLAISLAILVSFIAPIISVIYFLVLLVEFVGSSLESK